MNSFSGSGRGGLAPRRGRGYGGRVPFNKPREQVKPDIKKNPLGSLLKTILAPDLVIDAKDAALTGEITDCQYVSSYNWLNDQTPTIVIPGKPPKWTPLGTPQRLKEDSGQYFRDLNAAMYPSCPMAPVVRAVLEQEPEYPTLGIDLFACGSTLGNLLRFARDVDKAFRFNVEVIGNTVFFVRKENDPKELIEGVRGFGHTFPEAYTTWGDFKDSVSHQRIVRYTFGGMQCLVRFESDGYISDSLTGGNSSAEDASASRKHVKDDTDILSALHSVSLTPSLGNPSNAATTGATPLTIQKAGHPIPQASIFDLKTRSSRSRFPIDMNDIYPLLWLKQIPNFILAYHNGAGLFNDISVKNVTKDVQSWVKENTEGVKRFAVLLSEICKVARENEGKLMEVYCPGPGRVEIREQFGVGVPTLPEDLSERWASGGQVAEVRRSDSLVDEGDWEVGNGGDGDVDDDSDAEPDYTACSAEGCGYCGKCSY
ncbi:uncharacterized protein yc1106_06333 [Curvularia clavata]|uniref:Geranylgeranyl pyrophosphate synthetase n=1 Tax=Curvularia clavata TaxID=95742 RepID=A0A9Q9DUR4_CURCL|nr:uncharacterized protein yc1106_06333 [Curvularia clavata]